MSKRFRKYMKCVKYVKYAADHYGVYRCNDKECPECNTVGAIACTTGVESSLFRNSRLYVMYGCIACSYIWKEYPHEASVSSSEVSTDTDKVYRSGIKYFKEHGGDKEYTYYMYYHGKLDYSSFSSIWDSV